MFYRYCFIDTELFYRYWNRPPPQPGEVNWWPDCSHDDQTVAMTWAATILKTGLKEMEINWPWNWRLTVPKTIPLTLVRTLHDWFQMTVKSWLCFVSACNPIPLSIEALLLVSVGAGLWTDICYSPLVAGIWNKANFPFHKPSLLIGF